MKLIDGLHQNYVAGRRTRVLAAHLSALLPREAAVLDVGCGDGELSWLIQQARGDVHLCGTDVLVRPQTYIPVEPFDGSTLPYDDRRFDTVLFADVLHHTPDPVVLLREARRVARHSIVLKDHTLEGFAAGATLRFMDRVGNARYGVSLPYNYWTLASWQRAFQELGLSVDVWQTRLGLYPWPANQFFERSLHFVARLLVT